VSSAGDMRAGPFLHPAPAQPAAHSRQAMSAQCHACACAPPPPDLLACTCEGPRERVLLGWRLLLGWVWAVVRRPGSCREADGVEAKDARVDLGSGGATCHTCMHTSGGWEAATAALFTCWQAQFEHCQGLTPPRLDLPSPVSAWLQ